MGGADDAHVDRDFAAPAQALDHALLQDAQQLGLQRHGRSPISSRNRVPPLASSILPDGLLGGAGEGALLVAEQFGFQQGLGDRGAVDGDEALAGARRQFVHAARQHLLAGAGFAEQQHRGIGGRDLFHGAADLQHRLAAGDQALQRRSRAWLAASRRFSISSAWTCSARAIISASTSGSKGFWKKS